MQMTHGSLFSGIGGFDLAAEWMGWENVFHCEKDPFCQNVLKHYWPHAISYKNILETDFSIHRGRIDILTGGFPCQPFSTAGKRLGKEDERHLWPEYHRAIKEITPAWVVGENVRGLVSWNGGMVFDEACADLEAEGYEVFPVLLPAAGVNAPHRRDRIFFVAHSACNGYERNDQPGGVNATRLTTNAERVRINESMRSGQSEQFNTNGGQRRLITDPSGERLPGHAPEIGGGHF